MVTLKEAGRKLKLDMGVSILILITTVIGLFGTLTIHKNIELSLGMLSLCGICITMLLYGDHIKINQIRIAELEAQCRTIRNKEKS